MLLAKWWLATLLCGCVLACASPPQPVGPALPAPIEKIRWASQVTGGEISGEVFAPILRGSESLPAVVYLKNLSIPRIGTEADEPILQDLIAQGHLVLVLDYARHDDATSPRLNADILKLRQDIGDKNRSLLTNYRVDLDHLFILNEGFRLKRDVEFARDGARVLAMDVQYPSKPTKAVPLLMEITCDNLNRMGTFSLLYCRDTLLDGAMAAGFATAMVDHPVPPPYKGIDDPMPESLHRMKAAVRTLRNLGAELGTNGKIGAIGFSRGGPFAAMLAVTGDEPESQIQAALIHGNRYDYLNLSAEDPMLSRFEKAWGPLETNRETWAKHGAAHYLQPGKTVAPMFLNTSHTESPEFREGLTHFWRKLQETQADCIFQVDQDGRGHQVSTDPKTLQSIYGFFQKHLNE